MIVPVDFAKILQDLYRSNDESLNSVLYAANCKGWSYARLADTLKVTAQAIQQRCYRAKRYPLQEYDFIPVAPKREPKPKSVTKFDLEIPQDMMDKLLKLKPFASKVRGSLPSDHPYRVASEEFTHILANLNANGISTVVLARALNVKPNAIRFRLGRHGYRSLPPSQRGHIYQGGK